MRVTSVWVRLRRVVAWILMLDLRARATRWTDKATWIGVQCMLAFGVFALVFGDGGWAILVWALLVIVLGRFVLGHSLRPRGRLRRWLVGGD